MQLPGSNSSSPNNHSHASAPNADRMKMLVVSYKKEKELLNNQYEALLLRYRYI